MAQGRPLSRHGRYEALFEVPLGDAESDEFFKRTKNTPKSTSFRPRSGYNTREACVTYKDYVRVKDSGIELVSTTESDRHGTRDQVCFHQTAIHDPQNSSNIIPSPFSQDHSLNNQTHSVSNMQPRPPSSSGRPPTSGRPFSAATRPRSSARRSIDLTEHPPLSPEVLTEQSPRPPSAFSKYQILPAIGSPSPTDQDQPQESKHNPARNKKDQDRQPHPYRLHSQVSPHLSSSSDSREANVKSTSALVPSAPSSQTAAGSQIKMSSKVDECIERLDLSQLEKNRRKKGTSNTSPSHAKPKTSATSKTEHKPSEFYDADDDDSDSARSNRVSSRQQQTKLSVKKPVVIPSPDHCPARELLIAVKLPTDGARHQRYFSSNESLQTVVDFAEEVAGQDFGGYILVSSAPRQVYRDLYETIENAGLQDKIVLHLEEND